MKPKVQNETKEEKFKRIASARTGRILNDLRLLGNCANTSSYQYTNNDVEKIFTAIEKEYKRVKTLFTKSKTEFSL
jgi:Fe-S cluster biogenesis protein NfuA